MLGENMGAVDRAGEAGMQNSIGPDNWLPWARSLRTTFQVPIRRSRRDGNCYDVKRRPQATGVPLALSRQVFAVNTFVAEVKEESRGIDE